MAKYERGRTSLGLSDPKGVNRCAVLVRINQIQCAVCNNAFEDECSEDVYMPVCGCHIHEVCEKIWPALNIPSTMIFENSLVHPRSAGTHI
jgi:hypothetical protein